MLALYISVAYDIDESQQRSTSTKAAGRSAKGEIVQQGPEDGEAEVAMTEAIVKTISIPLLYSSKTTAKSQLSDQQDSMRSMQQFPEVQPPTTDLDPALDLWEAAICVSAEGLWMSRYSASYYYPSRTKIFRVPLPKHLWLNSSYLHPSLK